tara:strand:- start:58365 stop:58835 length:471 start_codon:yes stop_codon:yes gene_type:complete
MKDIAIVMGSDSDYEIMQAATHILEEFGVSFHKQVLSAHRTPEDMIEFGKNARNDGFKVIIAGAGGAAHLPGMLASVTTLPVIGVPIKLKALGGLDSLMSIVQMPGGVPVATVAINNAKNAAILAVEILSLLNNELADKLLNYKNELKEFSRAKQI